MIYAVFGLILLGYAMIRLVIGAWKEGPFIQIRIVFKIAEMHESSFSIDLECFVTEIISSLNIGAPIDDVSKY